MSPQGGWQMSPGPKRCQELWDVAVHKQKHPAPCPAGTAPIRSCSIPLFLVPERRDLDSVLPALTQEQVSVPI